MDKIETIEEVRQKLMTALDRNIQLAIENERVKLKLDAQPKSTGDFTREQMLGLLEYQCYRFGRESKLGWFELYPFDPAKERTYLTTEQVLEKYLSTPNEK